jgi:hypothetical protein
MHQVGRSGADTGADIRARKLSEQSAGQGDEQAGCDLCGHRALRHLAPDEDVRARAGAQR